MDQPLPPLPSRRSTIPSKMKGMQPTSSSRLGFRRKVQSANQTSICSATSGGVGRLTMRELLQKDKYSIPIFQRRYCWTETQWETLWNDIQKGGRHSMGRLTCTAHKSNTTDNAKTASNTSTNDADAQMPNDRSCILDGQQRFTTTTILLAAIRDYHELLSQKQSDKEATTTSTDTTTRTIDSLLFSDVASLESWLDGLGEEEQQTSRFEEGMELTFARLLPTFCDRISYYAAVVPSNQRTPGGDGSRRDRGHFASHRPMQARRYFDSKLAAHLRSSDGIAMKELQKFLHTLLDQFHMLYFPVTVDTGRQDGTEDLTVIYERLALRDATFCKPHREQEYVSMDGVDMIRNLLLGSFDTAQETLDFYKDYWLPLERRTTATEEETGDPSSRSSLTMHMLLKTFLENEQRKNAGQKILNTKRASAFGGRLYADFEAWMCWQAERSAPAAADPQSQARSIASRLLEFSLDQASQLPVRA